jgi:anti-sigma B factor antagonist
VFDRAWGWDCRPPGPGFGTGRNRAALNRAGFSGAGFNGAGFNGAGWNSAGRSSAGRNGAGLDGAGGNGVRLSSAGWNGTWNGPWNGTAATVAGPAEAGAAPTVALGLTHRIYPDGRAVAVIRGELDAATADQAQDYIRQVIDRSRGPVCLDMAGLTFCDARGLRTLVGVAAHARKAGRKLSLAAPRPAIVKIMRITGVDANFPELRRPGSHVTQPRTTPSLRT